MRVFLAGLFLVSCSTPYSLKKTEPQLSFVSQRPAVDVKKCIFKGWGKHHQTVFEEKTSEGWLIRYNDTFPGSTVAIVTVEGEAPEVKVNYHHRTNKIRLFRLEEEITHCK